MKLYISKDVQEKFPELEEIMLPVYNVNVQKDDQVLTKDCFDQPLQKYTGNNFYEQKYFVVFKEFCEEMGMDTKHNPPSVENLFKRYENSGKFPQINNIVDAANRIALETLVPTGVFDLDQIKGDLVLKFTKGGEEFHPLGGGVEILPEGITVIADNEKILNVFPYRDSIYQKITNKTKNILILADMVKGMDRNDVEKAVIDLGNLIVKVAGGKVGEVFSSQIEEEIIRPEKESPKENQTQRLNQLISDLKEKNIPFEIIEHPPINSVEEGLAYLGIDASQGVSTLIFNGDNKFFAVFRRDDHQLDNQKIKELLKVSNLRMASKDEIFACTNAKIGATPMISRLPTLMDETIFEKEFVYGGTGSFEHDLKIKPPDLQKATGAIIGNLILKDILRRKRRILTGDTPTGKLHIGHYVGTLKNRVELQKSYDTYILLANIHAYANDYTKTDLINQNVYEVFLDNLAVGIDPNVSTIFLESGIPEILELYGIFSMMVKHARALRNPSVKEEIIYKKLEPSVGFVIYPILQAADILGFNADLVPVGEDQLPVIEQTREIASDFNRVFGETFVIPQAKVGFIPRLVGIDGQTKMSKSGSNAILLSDDPETLKKKVNSIYTDPARIHGNEPGKVEGNPVFIYHDAFNPDKEEVKDLKDRYQKGTVSDREVKDKLFIALNNFLTPIREKRRYYEEHPDEAKEILIEGTKKARLIVQETIKVVREKIKMNKLIE